MLSTFRIAFIFIMLLVLSGCAASYDPQPLEESTFLERAQTKSRDGLTVTTAVLSRDESEEVFGVDLAAKGVQPVWIDIENNTGVPYMFMPVALDPGYFSPNEVSWMNHFRFGRSVNKKMDAVFDENAIELEFILPGHRRKGFVYTNLDPGVKFVNVTLYEVENTENFFFYFEVPGVTPDNEHVDFSSLYTNEELIHVETEEGLREALAALPCCTTKEDGTGQGDPINVIFVGKPSDITAATIKRRWDIAEVERKKFSMDLNKVFSTARYRTFPMSSLYAYGRRQDVSLQKSRAKTGSTYRQRNTLRVWLTPIRYKGTTVWAGAVSRDIGSDLRVRKYWFVAQEIDPDIDETRDYIVEDMILSGNVYELGFVKGVPPTTEDDPHANLSGLPWWSDGRRAVLFFTDEPVQLDEMVILPWEDAEY
jgi:hypothetical protein